eukprot:220624_1
MLSKCSSKLMRAILFVILASVVVYLLYVNVICDNNLSLEVSDAVIMHTDPHKLIISDIISDFSWTHSKCNLKSPFPAESSVSQTIYYKLFLKIYDNQFKNNPSKECSIDNYWIHDLKWGMGLGFMITNLAIELILAISRNKTFIYGPNNKQWPFYNEPNILTMEYYFEPITNCKLPAENILNKLNWSYSKAGRVLDDTAKLYWSSIIPN